MLAPPPNASPRSGPVPEEQAMSQQNVERVWAFAGAAANGGIENAIDYLASDIAWHLDSNHPDQRVLYGRPDVAEYFRGWSSSFDGVRSKAEPYIAHADSVLVSFVLHGRQRTGMTPSKPSAWRSRRGRGTTWNSCVRFTLPKDWWFASTRQVSFASQYSPSQ
jgi:hypothetical protein